MEKYSGLQSFAICDPPVPSRIFEFESFTHGDPPTPGLRGFDLPSTAGPPTAAGSPSDLALVRAVRAWGDLAGLGGHAESPPPWSWFSPAYRERLANAWASAGRITPESAWQSLLRDHQASSRFDPKRVHPSWFARILEAESPAIRRLVATQAPEPIRTAVRARLAASDEAIPSQGELSSPANPEAVAWALTLWTERLVGDVPESPDDPPIILALSRFSMRDLARLVRVVGQVKYAFAVEGPGPDPGDEAQARVIATDRVRIAYFRRVIGRADPRLIPIARGDFASVQADRRRKYAYLGLITVARLLKAVEARRARWAIQHVPYPIARQIGALGGSDLLGTTGLPLRAIRAWESWIFEAAWARLLSEGRLDSGGQGDRS